MAAQLEKNNILHNDGDHNSLSRQITVTLTPEQYEKMFFSPSGPTRGDLSKRIANPTLLGLIAFLVPYTSTMFILQGWGGSVPPTSLVGLTGDYYFFGAMGMAIAGITELILGNTYPFAVFIIFGVHWGSLGYTQDPIHKTTSAFDAAGGATGVVYNSSQAFHNVTMCIVCFVLFIGTFRVNVLFVLVFFGLVFLFAFLAAADFAVPHATTPQDLAHIEKLLKIAGGFGMLGVVCGWYLALVQVLQSVGLPCPLPIFDLSSKVFPSKPEKDVEKQA